MNSGQELKFLPTLKDCVVKPDATIKDGLAAISKSGALLAAVVDKLGTFLGIFTDADARRAILSGAAIDDPIAPYIKSNPVIAKSSAEAHELRELAQSECIREIPLVNSEGRLVDVFVIVNHEVRVPVKEAGSAQTRRPRVSSPMFLIAGGKGTRLKPVVSDRPKPLALVGNKPIIQTIIENAASAGIDTFYVSVNYQAELIEEHLKSLVYSGLKIECIREEQFLGTAGSLGFLGEKWREPIVVSNADVLSNVAIDRILDFHISTDAAATCVVRPYHVQIPFGVVDLGSEGVTEIREKPTHKHIVNTGIYVLSPVVQQYIKIGKHLDMPVLLQKIINGGEKVLPFLMHEYWRDVGHPEEYALANAEYQDIFGNRH